MYPKGEMLSQQGFLRKCLAVCYDSMNLTPSRDRNPLFTVTSRAHQASLLFKEWPGILPTDKRVGTWSWKYASNYAEIMIVCSLSSGPQYISTVWWIITSRGLLLLWLCWRSLNSKFVENIRSSMGRVRTDLQMASANSWYQFNSTLFFHGVRSLRHETRSLEQTFCIFFIVLVWRILIFQYSHPFLCLLSISRKTESSLTRTPASLFVPLINFEWLNQTLWNLLCTSILWHPTPSRWLLYKSLTSVCVSVRVPPYRC
jgi:hypothetical protein